MLLRTAQRRRQTELWRRLPIRKPAQLVHGSFASTSYPSGYWEYSNPGVHYNPTINNVSLPCAIRPLSTNPSVRPLTYRSDRWSFEGRSCGVIIKRVMKADDNPTLTL